MLLLPPPHPIKAVGALVLANIMEQLQSDGIHYRSNIYLQGASLPPSSTVKRESSFSFGDPSLPGDNNMNKCLFSSEL